MMRNFWAGVTIVCVLATSAISVFAACGGTVASAPVKPSSPNANIVKIAHNGGAGASGFTVYCDKDNHVLIYQEWDHGYITAVQASSGGNC